MSDQRVSAPEDTRGLLLVEQEMFIVEQRKRIRELEAQVAQLVEERDEALRSSEQWKQELWHTTTRAHEAETALREAEDFRAEIVVDAVTAPDADWNTILDSLRSRIAALSRTENT